MKLLKDKLTHNDYYQSTEYISNSMLNNLSGRSPEYFRFIMDNPQPVTPAMKFGSAIHMNVLQPEQFNNNYAVSPKFDKRTKIGKADYAEFQKKNFFKTIITETEFEMIEQMTMKLMKDNTIKTLLSGGEKEKIITWHNETHDVNCKGMLDCYKPKPNIIVDLIGEDLIEDGRYMYNQELEIYNYCTKHDYWPGQGYDYLNKDSERIIHIMSKEI